MSQYITQVFAHNSSPERDSEIIGTMVKGLVDQGVKVFYLDGRAINSKKSFFSKAAEVMQFPEYFGHNWDAFDECITDLEWVPAKRYVLIYNKPNLFAETNPLDWQIAYDTLQSAVDYWQSTDTPMDLLFIS
jgi:hypothetical protein